MTDSPNNPSPARQRNWFDYGLLTSLILAFSGLFISLAFNPTTDLRDQVDIASLRVPNNQRFYIFSDPSGAGIWQENTQESSETLRGYTNSEKALNLQDFEVQGENVKFRLKKKGFKDQSFTVSKTELQSGIWPSLDTDVVTLEPDSLLGGLWHRHPFALPAIPLGFSLALVFWGLRQKEIRRLQELEEIIKNSDGDPNIGKMFGEYLCYEAISRGGQGAVYLARTQNSPQKYALKVALKASEEESRFQKQEGNEVRELTDEEKDFFEKLEAREKLRSEREKAILREMKHKNVSRILDFGTSQGKEWSLMPFYPGGHLGDKIVKGIGPEEILSYARDMADGLHAIHQKGIIHRDLKPENVMIDGDRAVLIDFGLAKRKEAISITEVGAAMGTPIYMPPEQISDSKEAVKNSDQYSFGIILFEMITNGRLPYRTKLTENGPLMMEKLTKECLLLREIDPEQTEALEQVLAKMIRKEPTERYADVQEACQAFEAAYKA